MTVEEILEIKEGVIIGHHTQKTVLLCVSPRCSVTGNRARFKVINRGEAYISNLIGSSEVAIDSYALRTRWELL
tara:strand:+ start:255 stop:476 length:222 start_codon:yes stop_codon:yes gene_type:complete